MELTKVEQQFLDEKLSIQKELIGDIEKIEASLQPLEEEYNSLQVKIDELVGKQKVVAAQRREMVEAKELFEKKKELANVARDVTKLLQKKRK